MKKITALAALVASLAVSSAFAEDSYLYWLVDSSTAGFSWNYAELFATDGTTTQSVGLWGDPDTKVSSFADYATSDVTGYAGAGWSYYVELISGDDVIGISREPYQTYAALAASGAIRAQSDPKAVSPTTFNSFTVPEPSSGLMLLLGFALVGLKRKRA